MSKPKSPFKMITGVFCDNWKLPIFREELDKAGFTDREEIPDTMPSVSTFQITHNKKDLSVLKSVLETCQATAQRKRKR